MVTSVSRRDLKDRDTFRLLLVLSLTFIYPVFILSFFGLYVTVLVPLLVENNHGSERFYCHAYWLAVSLFWILLCMVVLPFLQDDAKGFSMDPLDHFPMFQPNVEAGVWRGQLQDNESTCSEPGEGRRAPPARLQGEIEVILESTERMEKILPVLEEEAEAVDEEDGETKSVKLECLTLSHETSGSEHFTATEGENDPQTTEEDNAKGTRDESMSDEVFDDAEVTENRLNGIEDDVANEVENKVKIVMGSKGFNEVEVETVSQAQPLRIRKAEGRETYSDDLLSNTNSESPEISTYLIHAKMTVPPKANKVFLFINTEDEGGFSES